MYLNSEMRSCNHCGSGEAMCIAYCECVCVCVCVCVWWGANSSSSMQYACTILYYHLWPVWMYRIFPHLINGTFFGRKLLNINCVAICSTLKYFSFLEDISEILLQMYIELSVNYLLFLFEFNET